MCFCFKHFHFWSNYSNYSNFFPKYIRNKFFSNYKAI